MKKNSVFLYVVIILGLFALMVIFNYTDIYGIANSALGAVITIFAVNVTIGHERKMNNEDKKLSLRPYLQIKSTNGKDMQNRYEIKIEGKEKGVQTCYGYFELSNVGLGTAINIRFHGIKHLCEEFLFDQELFGMTCAMNDVNSFTFYIEVADDQFEFLNEFPMKIFFEDMLNNKFQQVFMFVINRRFPTPERICTYDHTIEIEGTFKPEEIQQNNTIERKKKRRSTNRKK